MGSRHKWQEAFARFGALALLLALISGCTTSIATFATRPPSGGPTSSGGPLATGVHGWLPASSAAASPGPIDTGGPRTTAAPVTVDQITASYDYRDEYITPLAHLYGTRLASFVIVKIKNNNSSVVKIEVTSQITGYTDQQTDTVTISGNGTDEVRQNPRLTTAAIDSLASEHPADLHVVVSYLEAGQPRTVLDQTSQTIVTSRRDFPWKIQGFSDHQDHELLAVMVMENDPAVEGLIRKAANYRTDHTMGDPKSGDDALDQLGAVWQAEAKDYHLYYVSTTETFAANSQRIRLPGEVLPEASGNCIELTLLYASVAEALGLNGYLVLVPGHAYFAVDVTGQNDVYVLETTLIRGDTFEDALASGSQEWDSDYPHVQAGDPGYDIVDVAAARADGILPIPWH
jgi:hypothetical protein